MGEANSLPPEDDWSEADLIRRTLREHIDSLLITLAKLKTCISNFDRAYSPDKCMEELEEKNGNPVLLDKEMQHKYNSMAAKLRKGIKQRKRDLKEILIGGNQADNEKGS